MDLLPNSREIEAYLQIQQGAFDHIPHYARLGALIAIQNVRDMEAAELFRPGLYYIVISDLCRSTAAASSLGAELNTKRVESFILNSIEALGVIAPRNYFLPIREIGDATLTLFSSFADLYEWWQVMNQWLDMQNRLWAKKLTADKFHHFRLEAKTVVHAGEVLYSDRNIPLAVAVSQTFKVEKMFGAGDLGLTELAETTARPILVSENLSYEARGSVTLPGDAEPIEIFVVDNWGSTSGSPPTPG